MHEDLFRLNRSPDRARYKCMPYNYTKAISNKTKISLLKRRGVQVFLLHYMHMKRPIVIARYPCLYVSL